MIWLIVVAATLWLYMLIGHWSLMVPALPAALGTTYHYFRCHRHGIHFHRATRWAFRRLGSEAAE